MKHVATTGRHAVLLLLVLAGPVLLAPAPAHAQIYWANLGSDTIGAASLDGTSHTPALITVADGSFPNGLAVHGGYIYWTNLSANTIGRATLDLSEVNESFITGASAPAGIAVDDTHIYWTNQFGHTISRATLNKSEIIHDFITGASSPIGIVLHGSYIYWANQGTDAIARATLHKSEVVQNFITGANDPTGVAVHGSYLYWTNQGADAIARATLDKTEILQDFITGASNPYGIVVNDSYLYWANRGSNRIGRATLNKSEVNQNFIATQAQPRGVALGPGSVLPVELVSFTATLDGSDAVLAWETASETNNAGFEVEHRAAGAWQHLGFVAGAGTTAAPQSYAYRATGLAPGLHRFRLKQVDYDGAFEYSPEVEVAIDVPGAYALSAAYPNPFNPQATFTLAVAQRQHVVLTVHDALGRTVSTLFDGVLDAAAVHGFTVDGARLPSGTYLLRARGEHFEATQHLALVK